MRRSKPRRRTRVLAISSGGGHWIQLLRLSPAFAGSETVFVTVDESYREQIRHCEPARFYVVNDASRWDRWGLVRLAIRMARIVARERPDVVVSTGAAPGYLGMLFGKLLGARAAWVDSIANAETLSLSGRKAGRHADLWLTQWPHLARPEGPHFGGAVL